jgi:DNA-binding XRE family transcriptional regulator
MCVILCLRNFLLQGGSQCEAWYRQAIPLAEQRYEDYLKKRGHWMSTEFHHHSRDEFLAEFYPDPADKAAIAAGMEQLRAEQRAYRLAEMRRRLGITQADVAARMGVTQGRVSAIEHAKPGATELRTLAAYVEALGGRLEIIADFGDQRLAFTEPGTEAA